MVNETGTDAYKYMSLNALAAELLSTFPYPPTTTKES